MVEHVQATARCHCSAVRFTVRAPADAELLTCNCSICSMTGFVHLIVGKDDVVFQDGRNVLRSYRFGTETAEHLFCPTCGVKPIYVPRSHPDGWSVNANCIEDLGVFRTLTYSEFDGQNWEQNIAGIR